jgi:hypothetical protein
MKPILAQPYNPALDSLAHKHRQTIERFSHNHSFLIV